MTTRPTRPATRSATRLGAHAIVIGGSMAGLFAARVLADQFEHVTVVERDQLPEGPEHRPGVPQARHVHVLLRRGLVVMEELFPGLERELIAAGGISFTNADCLALPAAGWLGRFDGPRLLSGSRELLEWTVRGRVRALDNVDILCRQEVIGVFAKAVDGPVGGVDVRERGVSGTPSRRLTADLVVDASGRASKAPEWLE